MLQIPDGVIEVSDVIKEYNDNDYNNINNNISTNINNDNVLSIAILITLLILYLSQ